jgi:hypothetical protein
MLRVIAVLVGLLGLVFLGAGVASIVGSAGQAGGVPSMATGALLGAVLLTGSVLLWRRCAPHGAGQHGAAAHVAPKRAIAAERKKPLGGIETS